MATITLTIDDSIATDVRDTVAPYWGWTTNVLNPNYDPNEFLEDGVTPNPAYDPNPSMPNPLTKLQFMKQKVLDDLISLYFTLKANQDADTARATSRATLEASRNLFS